MTRRVTRQLATALAVACAACGGARIPVDDVPATPIAFSYRTQEEARQRADAYHDSLDAELDRLRSGALNPDDPGTKGGEIRARADQMRDFFGRVLGRGEEGFEEHPGRLALLVPSTGEVKVVEAARRGALPLDWSSDRTRLLFAQPGDLDFQVYELDPQRGTVRPITHGPPAHTQACYASDGRIVVVAAEATGAMRARIEVSRPGGGRPYTPVSEWGVNYSPTCSPVADAVVWERETADGRNELVMRSPIASGELRVLSRGRFPRYSPDGAWIVFSTKQARGWRIWRMRSDGSGRAPIGRGQRNESRPNVSPDGRFVVYVAAETPPRAHLYLRRFDGSGDRILFAEGDGEHPVW